MYIDINTHKKNIIGIKSHNWISFTHIHAQIQEYQACTINCYFVYKFILFAEKGDWHTEVSNTKLYAMKSDQMGFYGLILLLSVSALPDGLCGEAFFFFFPVLDLIHCACFNLTVAGALCM